MDTEPKNKQLEGVVHVGPEAYDEDVQATVPPEDARAYAGRIFALCPPDIQRRIIAVNQAHGSNRHARRAVQALIKKGIAAHRRKK